MNSDELGIRVIAALWEENSGNLHRRRGVIADRWFDAVMMKVDYYEDERNKALGNHEKQDSESKEFWVYD